MDARQLDRLAASMPLADGYRAELLRRADVATLVERIGAWYPAVSVGAASGYLREAFYREQVLLGDLDDVAWNESQRDVIVVVLRLCTPGGDAGGGEIVGMFSCERNRQTLSMYAGLGIAAPRHRGVNLVRAGLAFTEAVGRALGMGIAYGMATLKAPHAQRGFERADWHLVGITPGYDREMVAPGVVKRVYEAVYAKVLATPSDLLEPKLDGMTAATRTLFERLFPSAAAASHDAGASSDEPSCGDLHVHHV